MDSDWTAANRIRIDNEHPIPSSSRLMWGEKIPQAGASLSPTLKEAIGKTRDYLLAQQNPEGFWCAELEGDTILESEYILLLAFLGRDQSVRAKQAAQYIVDQQLPTGGWAIYPDGPVEISASVKAYWVLKITGHDPQAEYMQRACQAIRQAGGAEKVNSFTRYYMALLGAISYDQCPAVPPELILLPKWAPFNIYEMSAWSRTIVVPLSLLWAFRPVRALPPEWSIEELFLRPSRELPVTMPPSENVDQLQKKTWIDWHLFFKRADLAIKFCERNGIKPLRKRAIRLCAEWIQARFAKSDGLGAIFPPIIWSVIGLKCLGHTDDSPDVQRALNELESLVIESDDKRSIHLQPCKSPVWDTAISTIALREAGVPAHHPAIRSSVKWLLSKEVRDKGDWSVRTSNVEPAGWYFEFNNEFYPDIDDTIMVLMALQQCLPEGVSQTWQVEMNRTENSAPAMQTILAQRNVQSAPAILAELEAARPVLDAMQRGVRWMLAMQNNDGGWAAFDRDNNREVLTRVPFADHNAMIDPSTADITARVMEMIGKLGLWTKHPALERALNFVWQHQESDHCWIGRWGINYLYGTWQCLVGLAAVGIPSTDVRMKGGAAWLKSVQQTNGGWGETPRSYEDPTLRGQGTPTASQTAWALMGLCAAGEANSHAVDRGVQFLLETQTADGTWDEPEYTGTGFPRVFYLRYHLYRTYFPLMALARVARMRNI
ncbi:MAG: prenyltransferase/squalene oxidase repeat-containing protein [Planctomycetota bacterium]